MTVLYLLLILVGLVLLIDLVLTVGLVRRIRDHTRLLSQLGAETEGSIALPVGARVDEFSVLTTNGVSISLADLGPTIVGVFSPSCPACKPALPKFIERANFTDGVTSLAVVAADTGDAADLVSRLSACTAVVVEAVGDGLVQKALGVNGFPAFLFIQDGVVKASSHDLSLVADQMVLSR